MTESYRNPGGTPKRRGRPIKKELPETLIESTMHIKPYQKPDGWKTRYWAIYIEGELLAVFVYKKGAIAVAEKIRVLKESCGKYPRSAKKKTLKGAKSESS